MRSSQILRNVVVDMDQKIIFDLIQPAGHLDPPLSPASTRVVLLPPASSHFLLPVSSCLSSPVSSSTSVPLRHLSCPPPRVVHLILAILPDHLPGAHQAISTIGRSSNTFLSQSHASPPILLSQPTNHTSAPAIDLRYTTCEKKHNLCQKCKF